MNNETSMTETRNAILRKKLLKKTMEKVTTTDTSSEENIMVENYSLYKLGFNTRNPDDVVTENNNPIYIKADNVHVSMSGDIEFMYKSNIIASFSKASEWLYCVKLNDDGSLPENIVQWPGEVQTRILIDPTAIPDIVKTELLELRTKLENDFEEKLTDKVSQIVNSMLGDNEEVEQTPENVDITE